MIFNSNRSFGNVARHWAAIRLAWARANALPRVAMRMGWSDMAYCVVRGAWCVDSKLRHGWIVEQIHREGIVRHGVFLQFVAAFGRNHGQQKADDFCQQVHAVRRDSFAKDMTPFIIPVPAFARRAERVLVETRLIFSGPATVAFSDVATDPTHRPIQLVGKANRAFVLNQFRHIRPRQVSGEQRQAISLHLPKWVTGDRLRNRLAPIVIVHTFGFTHHAPRTTPPLCFWSETFKSGFTFSAMIASHLAISS